MNFRALYLFVILICLISQAFSLDLSTWQSTLNRGNPDIGSIRVRDGTVAPVDKLLEKIRNARFIAVGEVHDNPDHHRIQADILQFIIDSGKRPAVIFEMVPASLQPVLDKAGEIGSEELGNALDWEKRGWPAWSLYEPIARIAVKNGLPLVAGDLDRELVRAISRDGLNALSPEEASRIALDRPFGNKRTESLAQELIDSHCGLLPDAMIDPMVTVQRARDGSLAAAMASNEESGAFLVAGSGHVRDDRGATAVLKGLMPNASILTIALSEALSNSSPENTEAYSVFDFTIVTPKASNIDHCKALKERFSRAKQ